MERDKTAVSISMTIRTSISGRDQSLIHAGVSAARDELRQPGA
jgi:hypothetical protein